MIEGSKSETQLQMFKAKLVRIEEERTVDFKFSERIGTNYEHEFLRLDHFLATILHLVVELLHTLHRRR